MRCWSVWLGISCLLVGCAPKHFVVVRAENINLYLQVSDASQVEFASSSDDFILHRAQEVEKGLWVIRTEHNREFQYFYRIDGEVHIPDCRFKVSDDFGAANCCYVPDAGGV